MMNNSPAAVTPHASYGAIKQENKELFYGKKRSIFNHRKVVTSFFPVEEEDPSVATRSSTGVTSQQEQQRELELRVPENVLSFHSMIKELARQETFWASFHSIQIVLLVFSVMVLSVVYGHLYNGYPSLDDYVQCAMFGCTIVSPIYTMYVTKLSHKSHAQGQTLRRATSEVESQMFQFRALAGMYSQTNGIESAQDKEKSMLFLIDQTRDIYVSVEALIQTHGIRMPSQFWSLSESTAAATVAKTSPMHSPKQVPKVKEQEHDNDFSHHYAELPQMDVESLSSEMTPMANRHKKSGSNKAKTEAKTSDNGASNGEIVEKKKMVDNGYSMLSMDEYFEFRLKKHFDLTRCHLEVWNRNLNLSDRAVSLAVAATSATAALALQWTIPIILAFATALASISQEGLCRYNARVDKAKQLESTLANLSSWWNSLNDAEQMGENKNRLVQETEKALLDEVS